MTGSCNLPSRHTASKPFLSEAMKAKRLAFATAHQHRSPHMWKKVMFSDESLFELWQAGRFADRGAPTV